MTKLLPCPFCPSGKALVINGVSKAMVDKIRCVCNECWAGTNWYKAEEEAIAAWNRRAQWDVSMLKDQMENGLSMKSSELMCDLCGRRPARVIKPEAKLCHECNMAVTVMHNSAAIDDFGKRIQALEEHAGLRADSLTAKASREMGSE